MEYRPTPKSEFEQLLIGLIEEALSAADQQRLAEILQADPQARQYYVRYVALHANLQTQHVRPPVVLPEVPPPSAKSPSPAKSPVLGFLGGAMDYVHHSRAIMFWLIALTLTGWFAFQLGSLMVGRSRPGGAQVASQPAVPNSSDVSHPPGGPFANSASPRPGDPAAIAIVARMTAIADCHWRVVSPAAPPASTPAPGDADTNHADTSVDADNLFHVGSELPAGEQLDLVRGMAEITFGAGASVVLNGPAHFTVGSTLGGKLHLGKLTARVPHDAHGFTVESPAGKVVDLGTEFGVSVAPDRTMEVEVFVGEVSVSSSAIGSSLGSSQRLKAGHAERVVAGRPLVSIPLDPNRFIRGLGPREGDRVAHAAYLDWMRSLKPAVWFRMEGHDKERVLHDEMGAAPDGKLRWDGPGNAFVEGRLGKSLWLRGSKLKDGVIVARYPQAEHGKLSVAAWVYAASFPANSSSPAICNWSDTNTRGQFFLGLKGDPNGKSASLIAEVAARGWHTVSLVESKAHPFPYNEWQHVAFTTDGATLRLYRQGREVISMKHAGLQYPVRLQALGIGERLNDAGTAASPKHPDNWDGKLDEIAVFNDILSADDIRKMAGGHPDFPDGSSHAVLPNYGRTLSRSI